MSPLNQRPDPTRSLDLASLHPTRSLRSTTQPVPTPSHSTTSAPQPREPVNSALDRSRAWTAGPGVSPSPAVHFTDSEADIRADKGPDPPDGKSRVRLRLKKVEFEQGGQSRSAGVWWDRVHSWVVDERLALWDAGGVRSAAQERMREELMADLGMWD